VRKLISMAAFAAALLGLTAAVQAETPNQKWGVVGGWSIVVDPSTKGCFASGAYQDGSIVRIGFDATEDKLYLFFGNANWPGLKEGGKYPLRFSFDGGSPYTATLVGEKMGAGVYLVHKNITAEFAGEFMARFNLKIFDKSNKLIADLPLTNTYAAFSEVINCQRATNIMSAIGNKPTPPKPVQKPVNNTGPWIVALSKGDSGAHTTTGILNGSVAVTWIVDTGATFTSIPLEIAERLGAKEIRRQKFEMADGRVTSESIILVDKLSVGGVVVSSNVEVAVGARGSAPLLGKNWLDRFASFEVDNKSGKLTVRK
jgi:clan AA aspartic protease (TIGR02281 family)